MPKRVAVKVQSALQEVYVIAAIFGLMALAGAIYTIVIDRHLLIGGFFVFFTVLFAVISIMYYEQTAS